VLLTGTAGDWSWALCCACPWSQLSAWANTRQFSLCKGTPLRILMLRRSIFSSKSYLYVVWLPALTHQHCYKIKLKSYSAVIKGLSKHEGILVVVRKCQ